MTKSETSNCIVLLIKIKSKITIRAQPHTKQSSKVSGIGRTMETTKYNTILIKESNKSQWTGNTDSCDSINNITQQKYKNRKTFSQPFYNS